MGIKKNGAREENTRGEKELRVSLEAEACEINTLKHGRPKSNDATATRTWLKSEFAFFQSLTRLFILTYFVKCSGSLDLNSKGPYSTSTSQMEIFLVF